MNNDHFFEACDTLDAAVITGDALYDAKDREEFKEFLGRWVRRITEIEREDTE